MDLVTKTKWSAVYNQMEMDRNRGFDRLGVFASNVMSYTHDHNRDRIEKNLRYMIALHDNAERIAACVVETSRTPKLELVNHIEEQLRQVQGWPVFHAERAAEFAQHPDGLLRHLQRGWTLVKKRWAELATPAREHFVSRVFDQDAGYAHLVGTLEDYRAPDPNAVIGALNSWLGGIVWANPFTGKVENVHLRRRDCIERDWDQLRNPQNKAYEALWQGILYVIAENLGMQLDGMPSVVRQSYRQILKQVLSFVQNSGEVIDGLLDTPKKLEQLCGME